MTTCSKIGALLRHEHGTRPAHVFRLERAGFGYDDVPPQLSFRRGERELSALDSIDDDK